MSKILCSLVRNLALDSPASRHALGSIWSEQSTRLTPALQTTFVRNKKYVHVEKPKPGDGAFRRIVHYPEEYTIQPLPVTNLGGRDPVTGRMVAKGIGGGIKHKYHWIDWHRVGPIEGAPMEERVLQILKCGCRTGHVALIGRGDHLRYILATENMKVGDIVRTSGHIPRIPVRANEGDAYPLGALPQGTQVHCVELLPGAGGFYARSAGSSAIIGRKVGGLIQVFLPSKRQLALKPECMATVGQVSNAIHSKTHIGSAQANRWLGNRPRSGLWQRKTGYHGFKDRKKPPMLAVTSFREKKAEPISFTLQGR